MSRDFGVYLHTHNLPTPKEWKEEILQQGFPCELDSDIALLTFSGFLPCSVNGVISGFEYYASDLDNEVLNELDLSRSLNFDITFCAGAPAAEAIAALAAASCLTKLSEGYLVDFCSGKTVPSDEVIEWAKSQPEMQVTFS